MWGVIGTSKDQPDGVSSTEFSDPETKVDKLSDADPLKACLAACHSLTTVDGKLVLFRLFT
jgi:hypothetical protein